MEEEPKPIKSEEDEALLEQMLMEAERLALQMRTTLCGEYSGSNIWQSPPKETIPESIETSDNQTECSSIGMLGHAVENLKWSPSMYTGYQGDGIKDTIDEESQSEDDAEPYKGSSARKQQSVSDSHPRSIKRSIEELVQKSKACVQLESNLRHVASSLGESQSEILSFHNKDLETTIKHSLSEEDKTTGLSLGTTYFDVKSVLRQEEKKCDDESALQKCISYGIKLPSKEQKGNSERSGVYRYWELDTEGNGRKNNRDPSNELISNFGRGSVVSGPKQQNILEAAEEVERALKVLGASSQNLVKNIEFNTSLSDLPSNEPLLIDESLTTRIIKDHDFSAFTTPRTRDVASSESTPQLRTSWNNWMDVTQQDDDYVSIADYCKNDKKKNVNPVVDMKPVVERPKEMKPVAVRRKSESNGTVKWESITSAEVGDEDFVPVQDYSFTTGDLLLATELYKNENSGAYRALLTQRKKVRRRRAMVACAVVLTAALSFPPQLRVTCSEALAPFILQIQKWNLPLQMSKNDSSSLIDTKCTIIGTEEEEAILLYDDAEIESRATHRLEAFWIAILPNVCAQECVQYFEEDSVSSVAVPIECSESFHLETSSPDTKKKRKEPPICLIPVVSNLLPFCHKKVSEEALKLHTITAR